MRTNQWPHSFVLCGSLLALAGCSSSATPGDGAVADASDVARSDTSADASRSDTTPGTDAVDIATTTDVPTTLDVPNPTDVPTTSDVVTPMDVPVALDVPLPVDVPVIVDLGVDLGTPIDIPVVPDVPVIVDTGPVDTGVDVPLAPICGNHVIEGSEECDDGNLLDLDGCDAQCRYEVISRMTAVTISGTAAPAFCTPATNALGTRAFTATALSQLNTPLQTDVTNGTTNVLVQFQGLTDLTGASGTGISLGVMGAAPDPARGTWPPAGNPIDWSFLIDPNSVSAGLPTNVLTGASIVSHVLTAGPSTVNLTLDLAGSPVVLQLDEARLNATINATPAPDVPAPPPGALAPGTNVFQTVTASGAGQGLCGNITVASLAQIPVPQTLTTGTAACGACAGSHTYTYCGAGNPVGPGCNSLLDVLVGGCKVVICLVAAVTPTQPDVAGGTTVRALTVDATTHKVPASQITGNTDAYSAFLTFTANRAHASGESCTLTSQCQTGQTCTGGTCH